MPNVAFPLTLYICCRLYIKTNYRNYAVNQWYTTFLSRRPEQCKMLLSLMIKTAKHLLYEGLYIIPSSVCSRLKLDAYAPLETSAKQLNRTENKFRKTYNFVCRIFGVFLMDVVGWITGLRKCTAVVNYAVRIISTAGFLWRVIKTTMHNSSPWVTSSRLLPGP